ncbi:glycoside hydrolase family 18 protein [Streptomyces calidiresistens]|uniref:chitinase n=1 Tax=Streptomyces calidiresistens TaxID=1485586 RepID=A0A7W3T6S5_9ACTN|nr:chitinase [Streptomyces calidiresistens]
MTPHRFDRSARRRPRRGRLVAALATGSAAGALLLTGLPGIATADETTIDANAADNLLVNPGFESGLSGWTCSANSGSVVSDPVRSGSGALAAAPAGSDNARCEQTVSVRPGSEYRLSGWVRGGYTFLGAVGPGTEQVSTWTPGAGTWQELSLTVTTGPGTEELTVFTHGWYGTDTYLVDDLVLAGEPGEGGPGDPPVDPPTDPPAAPGGVGVSGTTPTSVSLEWQAVEGAERYHVAVNGERRQTVTGTSVTVGGLTPDTTYRLRVTAENAGGESAPSAEVSATTRPATGGGNGSGVPRHAVTGYWHNFDNNSVIQKLRDVPRDFDIIAVSFADATPRTGEIEFNLDPSLGYSSEQEFKDDIAAKQAEGVSVIISVGGEVGNVIINDAASARRFADSTLALMDEYGFDGVDIDLEHGINATYLTQAMRDIHAAVGDDLVYTMAPQTIDMQHTGTEYFKLALNTRDFLTVVNMQYYNSGSMMGCDNRVYSVGSVDFLTALACIQLESGLDASQVGIGVPASPRAAGNGYVSPETVNRALDCLTRGTNCGSFTPPRLYPELRGAMTWSTNWDAHSGYAWSSVVGPHVRGLS